MDLMDLKALPGRAEMASGRGRGHLIQAGALVVVILGILIVTDLPYGYAYRSTPADKQFMGILLNVPDTAQYFSWAREFRTALTIDNKLTPERGDATFFNLFWFGVGRLSVALGAGIVETTRVVRLLAGAVYLGAMYWITGIFCDRWLKRWASFLVLSLGGGLGWVLVVAKQVTGDLTSPLDLYVTEPNTFLTVLAFPHQAMASGLVVIVLGLAALAFERESFGLAVIAGFVALLLGLQHGYDLIVIDAVVGVTALLLAGRTSAWVRYLALAVAVGGPSVPVAVYLLYLTRKSSVWGGVLAQYGNAGVYTPKPLDLLVLMGLPLVLLVVLRGEATHPKSWAPRELLLRTWLVVGCLLLYLPTDFQIKMLAGWQVPVGILATRAVLTRQWVQGARGSDLGNGETSTQHPGSSIVVAMLLLGAVLPTNLYLYAWRLVDLGRHTYPYYLSRDDVAALGWLEARGEPSDVVLSSLVIGQYIPSVAGDKAFLAHWAETLDFYGKQRMVASFFDASTSDVARSAVLSRFRVRYVFSGEPERALGGFDPNASALLCRVYVNPHVAIYRVASGPGDSCV
jgi:hypothetical protein